MGEAFGTTSGVCSRCRSKVEITVETDLDGGLIDVVQPCPRCLAPKMVLRPIARPRSARPLIGVRRTSPLMILALAKVRSLAEQGDLTTAQIAAQTGVSQDAVRKVRREIETDAPKTCGCGKLWTHGGRCSWRRNREAR